MKNNTIRRFTFSIVLPFGLFFFIFSQWDIFKKNFESQLNTEIEIPDLIEVDEKQKGAHVFGLIDSANYASLSQHNFEWITLVPWGSQENCTSPIVEHHYGDSLRTLRSDSNWVKRIEAAHTAGFKVFFKPHVWIDYPEEGKWRSDIFPKNEEDWQLWKESYRDFILRYAKIAEQTKAEMFCIGTEFSLLTAEKSSFWEGLIGEVRAIYSGEITYAANWYNEFEKITFWDKLDFIGIQAYFPLVENNYPSVEQISKGWKKHLLNIETIHKKYKRKVLFTEMGYKSTADSAIKPWEWIQSANLDRFFSAETQANCYGAFFNTVWKKKWFAGVHIWELRGDYVENKAYENLNFTPQGKLVEAVIAKGFE